MDNSIIVKDVSHHFNTPTARSLQAYRNMRGRGRSSTVSYLQKCVEYSTEREKIFRLLLKMQAEDEPKRAELKDLSLTLLRKVLHHLGADKLNRFSEDYGFFVYNQNEPRSIAVVPRARTKSLRYLYLKGLRMRSMDPTLLTRLARVGYLPDHTAYLQPKVLDHEEYEHLIDMLEQELEEGR